MMQDLVGIVRQESEMREALERLAALAAARGHAPASAAIANTTTAGTRPSTCTTC